MTENERKFVKDHFDEIARKAIELGDKSLFEKIEKTMALIKSNNLEAARKAVEEINYRDFQSRFYVAIACLSREERDIKMLRKMASDQISRFGSVQTGILICIAMISKDEFDIKRARRAIEKNSSFVRVQEFLVLNMNFGKEEDLDSARKAAEVEVPGRIYYRTAGLTIIAAFTGKYEDYSKMEVALSSINEPVLRQSIPADINIDKVIKKANDFRSAVAAVEDIVDDYMRAKMWTLIGISQLKTSTTVITT
ncbi:MAG: hypothetical protein NTW46_02455 [Candidatus Nealsonbacteria bacterium]|nr:hypothetical protein [Candidatus Nealsonbacteria bacterium]